MDSLDHLRERLQELITGKFDRLDALRQEQAAIEAELLEANGLLERWDDLSGPFGRPVLVPADARASFVDAPGPRPAAPYLRFSEIAKHFESGPLSLTQVGQRLGRTPSQAWRTMNYWCKKGELVRYEGSIYGLPPQEKSG